MSDWKHDWRSFYYAGAPEPPDPVLERVTTALLVIDMQNVFLQGTSDSTSAQAEGWSMFRERIAGTVIPATQKLLAAFRERHMEVLFARIGCLLPDGRDRSLSQKKPGWNNLLLPVNAWDSQIAEEVAPLPTEIVVTKTTDSALTGTNLRLVLTNLGIRQIVCTGIFTDQCVSSTVRSLADESFDVFVVEDACAAGTEELHLHELSVLNMIYCSVMRCDDLISYLP